MKRYFAGVASVIFFALAGCGGGGNNSTCGALNQACCTTGTQCTAAGTTCQNSKCMMVAACGATNAACCTTGAACTSSSDTCTNGVCTPAQMNCGAVGQACCANMMCNNGLMCMNGSCAMVGGNTGDPCTKPTDCAGTKPACVTKGADGTMWPGGYCTSSCNPQKNDQSGLNSTCPGGTGTCIGQGTTGACETACTSMAGQAPCTRQGYSCFQACEPTAESECDPTMKGSCPQDGGVTLMDGTYSGRSCVRIGADDVGACTNGCDPFKQDCMQIMGMDAACYASDDTGEGVCSTEFGSNQTDGTMCMYLNACDPGLACVASGNSAVCRPYCGGPGNVACAKCTCNDLSTTVKKTVIGVCSM